MNKILNNPIWNTHALLVARILMGGFFALAGFEKLTGIEGTAGFIASVGLPAPLVLAYAAGLLELVAGLALIVGKFFKESALSLTIFVAVVSFIFHSPSAWAEDPMQRLMFIKNMAILSGLLFMVAHGTGGSLSLEKKK